MSAPSGAARDRPLRALGFMVLGALSFALMNALARGMRELPYALLAFCRALFGFGAALGVARLRGASLVIVDRRLMWQRSLAGSCGMLCTFYALTHMPLADATALLNTTPLWIAALAWAMLRERPSTRVAAALLVASAGVALVERPGMHEGGFAGLVALAGGASSALAMVSLRRLSGETPEAVVVHFSAIATAATGALSLHWLATRAAPVHVSGAQAAAVLVMGLSATVGQLAITRAYALDKAARVGAAGWLQVLVALAIDAAVFARLPVGSALVGIALLLVSGVLLVVDARRGG